MTPKEKAKELYNKCNPHCLVKNFYGNNVEIESTKLCALVAVDEVQRLIKDLSSCNYRFIYIIDEMNYWNEVKQEIEKL